VLDREANGGPPHGRALDLGTGSGIWGIELARRGWEVTGVNHVEKALRRARERISEAASRSSSCAATSRRCARPGSAPATGCCSTPELPSAHRDDGLAGELGGKCLVRFGLTDPGRVAIQHAAAVVVPVGGRYMWAFSIVMAPGSADRASRTSSQAPASPRTGSTTWQSSLRRCAASYEADHIARHPRAVRAWDRRSGRMVS
jgi:SAM-dependent methyltransferase